MIKISNNMQCIYDLDKLMQPFDFITNTADGIERVEIISITLESLAGDHLSIIVRSPNEEKSIFVKAQEALKTNDPLEDSFTVRQVVLLFSFFSSKNLSFREILLVTLTKPCKCTISNKTGYNLVNKYLQLWNLVKKTLIQSMFMPKIYLK